MHQESLSRIIITMAGTEASGLVKFCVDSFGSCEEMSKGQAEAALHIPQEGDIEEEEEDVELSTATSDPVTAKQPDICSLADSKLAYPTDSNSLSVTGVSPEFYSENVPIGPSRQSTYFCLFGPPCTASAHQKASIAAHICHKHLGVSIACKYCDCRWWTSNQYNGHMQRKHPEIEAPGYWSPAEKKKADLEEAKSAEEAKEAPKSVASLL